MNTTKVMSRAQVLILATLAIFVMASAAWANTYYVDATKGNDNKNGQSSSTAWKTIAKVNASSFNPGDQILFKRGNVWRETLIAPSCGSSGNPITFGAYGSSNNKPIISGADDVTTDEYKWIASGQGNNKYYLKKASVGNPGIINPLLVWMDQECLIKGTAGSLFDHQWACGDIDGLGYNTVYIRDDSGDPDISGVLIEAGNRDTILEIGDRSYLNFVDLELRQSDALWGGVVHIYDSYNITFDNCIMHDGHYAVFYAYHSDADPPSGITINSSVIYGCRRTDSPYGMVINLDGCNNFTIKNCKVYESSNPTASVVIYLHKSNNNIIEYNDIYGPAGNLLYLKESSDFNIVRYNKFHDSMGGMGIQIRINSNDNRVFYNVIYIEGGPAIQSDGDVPIDRTKIYNNTIYTTGNNCNGISIHNTNTNCEVKNNLVYVGEYSFALHIHENSKNGVVSDHNIFRNVSGALITWAGHSYTMSQFPDYQSQSGQDSHSTTNDPEFVSSENHDFRLQSTSSCINTGTYVGLSKDFEGTSVPQGDNVDMGAFEYIGIKSPAPPKNLRTVYLP